MIDKTAEVLELNMQVLVDTANGLVAYVKGPLATDESNPTCNQRPRRQVDWAVCRSDAAFVARHTIAPTRHRSLCGGNDYPAKEAGVLSIQVRDPNESKRVIEAIIACLDGAQPPKPPEETHP